MRNFYKIITLICGIICVLILFLQVHNMLWGKIVLALAAAFGISALLKVIFNKK